VAKFFFEEIGNIRFLKCEFGKKMLNKWNFFEKVYKPQNRKKKKEKKRERKTLIIFVSGIPGTNIMP
jgi:hypothetical protein